VSQITAKSLALESKTEQLEVSRREVITQRAELTNLRSLVKRLFTLLRSDSSDLNLSSDSEVDRVFAEWVERQELKKKGK
jgi:hypothetical protein